MPTVTLGGYWYADAVRNSALPSASRLIALALCTVADNQSATVRRDVSLTTLQRWTGLSRSAVRSHLRTLELAGWLVRQRPSVTAARLNHETTAYRLTVPPADLPAAEARAGRALGLGREKPQARNPDALGLGQEKRKARASGALISLGTRDGSAPRGARCPNNRPVAADGSCCGETHNAQAVGR